MIHTNFISLAKAFSNIPYIVNTAVMAVTLLQWLRLGMKPGISVDGVPDRA